VHFVKQVTVATLRACPARLGYQQARGDHPSPERIASLPTASALAAVLTCGTPRLQHRSADGPPNAVAGLWRLKAHCQGLETTSRATQRLSHVECLHKLPMHQAGRRFQKAGVDAVSTCPGLGLLSASSWLGMAAQAGAALPPSCSPAHTLQGSGNSSLLKATWQCWKAGWKRQLAEPGTQNGASKYDTLPRSNYGQLLLPVNSL
jgi:hypothetical protein